MSKDSFWFKHDYNARGDSKMIALRKEMGMEGVGIYWAIIEIMYEEGGYIPLDKIEIIAYELRVKPDKILKVLNSFGLSRSENGKVWSDSVINRLDERTKKSQKARESVNTRYERTTNVDKSYEKRTIEESRVEKKRGEERREDFTSDWEDWGKQVVENNDATWQAMRGRKVSKEEIDQFISVAIRNSWKMETQQQFRKTLHGFNATSNKKPNAFTPGKFVQ